ncbi:MAG: MotA/TolQ/ExbB proton channel family protein [Kiritimatiellae bacterium]|nr:MotA/TolQ/ExbB proton channel family protein [Kiritimatiellia bacterium]MBP5228027.1 MotA/TolQ/ExbB proton channel family protein [Kiritimatiellia bacterium]
MKKVLMAVVLVAGMMSGMNAYSQEADAEKAAVAASSEAKVEQTEEAKKAAKPKDTGFLSVITGSGWLGVVLWLALFGCGAAAIYFIVDSFILVKPQKIMPPTLINNVKAGMAEGDVMKALKACENEPGPMANILSAGFSHVEEGFDVIQEAIGAAADLETERIMQHLNWISVCSNLSPMLGLLGTVQGMIMCFKTLATGAPDVGALALAISQALWTTAGGLTIAIPSITFYYSIRNNANRLILRMQAMTMELIKDLRNVEVVE